MIELKTYTYSGVPVPAVVAVGGLDPSGGAGLFVDQLAIRATGCDFAGICAVLTIQNGIEFVQSTPQPAADVITALALIQRQKNIDVIKTGALGNADIIDAVCRFADENGVPLIVDPVVKSTSGGELIAGDGGNAHLGRLIASAALVTPNVPEAEIVTGRPIQSVSDMRDAAWRIIEMGAGAVLIKGGHLRSDAPALSDAAGGNDCVDVLVRADGQMKQFRSRRLPIGEVRGTGCALASLIAGQIALGEAMENGVEKARQTLLAAMKAARFPSSGPGILQF